MADESSILSLSTFHMKTYHDITLVIVLMMMSSISAIASTQTGTASWYGKENSRSCTGKKLQHKIPATAHRTLPIGSVVKITALKTGKSVLAVVEDRGPYTKHRLVDVNIAAARKLGMIKRGITTVRVETISWMNIK